MSAVETDSLELLTEKQVAKLMQMSCRWIREQRKNGLLPFRRLGPAPRGEVRFTRSDVEALQCALLAKESP